MKKSIDFMIRFLYLVIGSLFMALGSRLAAASQFGADVVVLVWEGLEHAIHMDMGMANLVVSLTFLSLTFFLNRRHIGFGTVAGIFLQSMMIHWIHFDFLQNTSVWIRIVMMVVGISFIAVGCSVYAIARLGVGPYVGVILSSHDCFKVSITRVKFYLDSICVVLAVALGVWPSFGPVVSLLISGFIMDGTMKLLTYLLNVKKITDNLVENVA